MGAAGSVDFSGLTEEKYGAPALQAMFGDAFDLEMFQKYECNGFVTRENIINVCKSQSNG
jgi:hypothetical protein